MTVTFHFTFCGGWLDDAPWYCVACLDYKNENEMKILLEITFMCYYLEVNIQISTVPSISEALYLVQTNTH